MDYEKKYKAALGWMKSLYGGLHGKTKEEAEHFFPELKESKDEMIREKLIEFFKAWGKRVSHCWGLSIPDILAWLEKQGEPKLASSAKTCENDTLLDLLNKMPSCITLDGIVYHFVMAKHSYYIAYYKGNREEYSGNAIFGVTSFSPIDLLTEMLDKLKKEGLLE